MATTYPTLKYGSTGSDVKTLQSLLKKAGVFTGNVGGNYKDQTQAAVKAYQKANGLSESGVADADTWAKLTYVAPSYANTSRGVQYDINATTATQADLADVEGNAPATYVSPYSDTLTSLLNDITSRADFSYDFSSDPVYQQQMQQYQQAGKTAMQDTVGEAAALSGGYGNSYGVTAGQQAYNSYLQGANDIIPDLYSTALDQYNAEGTAQYNKLSAVQGLEDTAYSKYASDRDAYYNELAYYQQKAAAEQGQSNWQSEFDYSTGATSSSGGSSSGSSSGGKSSAAAASTAAGNYDFSDTGYNTSANSGYNKAQTVKKILEKYGTSTATANAALNAAIKKGVITENDIKRAASQTYTGGR